VQFSVGPGNRLSVPSAKLTDLAVGLNDRPELTRQIEKLIEALDSETARDKAARELTALGPSIEAAVRKHAAAGSPARRAAIAGVLKAYQTWSADHPNARTVIGRAAGKNRDSWRDTYFPGPIDEIKIWKRALRPTEVKLLYAQTLAKGKPAPARPD